MVIKNAMPKCKKINSFIEMTMKLEFENDTFYHTASSHKRGTIKQPQAQRTKLQAHKQIESLHTMTAKCIASALFPCLIK